MRFVVLGAGAIGGAVGARLLPDRASTSPWWPGASTVAPSSRASCSRRRTRRSPCPSPPSPTPPQVAWDGRTATVVLLAVKGQHTEHALTQLTVAPPSTPVVCMQNGVENERRVLRHFPHTYGMCVMCPATQLRPGVVQLHSAPVSGMLDLGRYPAGIDDTGQAIADAIATTTFQSVARPDIMRWKYRKLLMNLANAVEALCGPEGTVQPAGAGGPARGHGGARRGRHRRGQLRGGPRAAGRPPPAVADLVGGVAGRVQLAEPGPRGGLHRGRVPQR